MQEVKAPRRPAPPGSAVTRIITLVLVICLVECATEQRINRGSNSKNLLEKINGWRSQRGGSCLSYGHSCWGAHGKRSGKPPVTATDWYLRKILHQLASNAEMNRAREATVENDDLNAIFRGDDNVNNRILVENEDPVQDRSNKAPEAKPMLDDELLSKINIWKIMRESSQDK